MTRYYLIILLLSLTFILTNCIHFAKKNSSISQKKELQISLKLLQEPTKTNLQGNKGYPAKITLTNNTDSIIAYWTMSCSWTDNWSFDTDCISFKSQGCDKNIPQFIELKTNQSIEYDCILNLHSDIIKQFKLGFVLLGKNDFSEFENRMNWRSFIRKHKIYWSDTICIDLKKYE